jgi:hypothetical protein
MFYVYVERWDMGASMSAEKNFVAKVLHFYLWVGFCFGFCMVFWALLVGVLWCVSTWFVVCFDIV